MGIFSKFEGKVDDALDGIAGSVFKSPIEPSQIAKRCEKQMHRNKLVGKGAQYAPTLYTVLVNTDDDRRLFGFYPTMAGEIETFLVGSASDADLTLECRPLVRFIADDDLKSGKFDVIAEVVTANIISELREEEAEYYGLDNFSRLPVDINQGARPRGTRNREDEPRGSHGPMEQRAAQGPARDFPQDGRHEAAYQPQPVFDGLERLDDPAPQPHGASGGGYADYDSYAAAHGLPAHRAAPAEDAFDERYGDYEDRFDNQRGGHAIDHIDGRSGGVAATAAPHHASSYGYQPAMLVNAMTGDAFHLDRENMLLGREDTCDIAIPDASISRAHARLSRDEMGDWSITDLGSTNGTAVNGHKIRGGRLRYGDQITVGTTILLFQKG